jgi:hypothetical protein
MAASLRGPESGTKVHPLLEDVTRQRLMKTVTENASLCVIVICKV